MVKFLLTRPVAVTMSFIAVLFLGMVSLQRLPVSLMPDIAIPEITVQLSSPNTSARELENSVVQHLRRQLMQVNHLEDIHSETTDGLATIRLNLEYGTDVNYAFIEVNEKIDMAMNYMPRHVQRPRVMKAGVGDIPVLWLNLSQKKSPHKPTKNDTTRIGNANAGQAFADLSRFAANVISKRLEQLPEVAMVDISGMAKSGIRVVPDMKKLDAMGLLPEHLEQLIKINNNKLGSLSVKDGQYLYNIRFTSELLDRRDIEEIYFNHNDRVFQLKDIALIEEYALPMKGMVVANGDAVVSMAVIKQSDAQINQMKKSLQRLINQFKKDYPDIAFEVTRDQTLLLDYSINNLKQNLLFGSLLAFIIMFFFLRDFKSPFLIGIVIPLSLLVSLLFFHVLKLSINIISLSGLVLGVGMMIDNSIIVIDNITQHWERNSRFQVSNFKSEICNLKPEILNLKPETSNLKSEILNLKPEINNQKSLLEACERGTNEIIRPLLSSVLTTCAVFIPLIFLKGIAGALFYDQAMAVTIGLFSSLAVSISVLPVYYLLFYKKGSGFGKSKLLKKFNAIDYAELYEKGFRLVMRNKLATTMVFVLMLVLAAFIFTQLPRTKLPVFEKDELLLSIDWNEAMHPEANRDLTLALVNSVSAYTENYTAMIGEQQFLLDKTAEMGPAGALVYFKVKEGFRSR
jgi:multidrug efflux pump subunit AcrB